MVEWSRGSYSDVAGFYLVGFFEIDKIAAEIKAKPAQNICEEMGNNVHMKRAEWDATWYDRFWVFKGSKRSRRFKRAVPFTRHLADRVLLDREGNKLRWETKRTELQSIGSYTRACRIIENEERIDELLSVVAAYT